MQNDYKVPHISCITSRKSYTLGILYEMLTECKLLLPV